MSDSEYAARPDGQLQLHQFLCSMIDSVDVNKSAATIYLRILKRPILYLHGKCDAPKHILGPSNMDSSSHVQSVRPTANVLHQQAKLPLCACCLPPPGSDPPAPKAVTKFISMLVLLSIIEEDSILKFENESKVASICGEVKSKFST